MNFGLFFYEVLHRVTFFPEYYLLFPDNSQVVHLNQAKLSSQVSVTYHVFIPFS